MVASEPEPCGKGANPRPCTTRVVSIDRTIGDFRVSLDPTTLGSCLLSLRFYPFTASKIVNEVLIKSLQMSKEVGFLCP